MDNKTLESKESIKENILTCVSLLLSSKITENISKEKLFEAQNVCCKEIEIAESDSETKEALEKFARAFVNLF